MKRLMGSILLSLLILQSSWGQSIHASRDNLFESELQKQDDALFIKYSDVAKAFDLEVNCNNEIIKINDFGNELILTVGSKEVTFNGKVMSVGIAPIKQKECIYVPLVTVATLFGYDITYVDGEIVIKSSLNQNDLKCLEEIEVIVEEQKDILRQMSYVVEEYNDFKLFNDEGTKNFQSVIKKTNHKLVLEEEKLINEIKIKQKQYTPMAYLLSNDVIAILALQKSYLNEFPLNQEENQIYYKQVEAAYESLNIKIEKLTLDYYGFESTKTLYDIIQTFEVAEDYIYRDSMQLKNDEQENQVLMLKAKKMHLEYIKQDLQEKEIIELTNRCIACIEDKLKLLEIVNQEGITNKETFIQSQKHLDKKREELGEEFWRRGLNPNITEIDDSMLSDADQVEGLIPIGDSNKLAAFKNRILTLAKRLDVLGARFIEGKEMKEDLVKFGQELEKLRADYIVLKKSLNNVNSKSYLGAKNDLMDQIQAIYDEFNKKGVTNKRLLILLNELEENANQLYLRGYYVYEE